MPDVFTKTKRSAVMARIRGAGNKDTELRLIVLMRAAGIVGWRRNASLQFEVESGKLKTGKVVRVKPDFVFRAQRLAVFVDGCFWHGCPRHATWPKNNAAFWEAKIRGNQARDRLQNRLVRKSGWKVVRVWEHALTARHVLRTIARIRRALFV